MSIFKIIFVGCICSFLFRGANANSVVHINQYAKSGQDVTKVLQYLIDNNSTIVIDEGTWFVTRDVRLRSNVTIEGVDVNKSIIKRLDNGELKGGMLFMTEYLNPDIYTKLDKRDAFSQSRLNYKNIKIRKITFDLNRHPSKYTHQQMTASNIYCIAFVRASSCSVENCHFVDYMTPECNNGYPAVVFLQSSKSKICNCESQGITFCKAIYSDEIIFENNNCKSSVGTPIEAMGGRKITVIRNAICNVYWNVSCIGINTRNSVVSDNEVYAQDNNISCITLGHAGYALFSADNAVVKNNKCVSKGCRSIIIQNGHSLEILYNTCSCLIKNDSPILTSGAIVASGENSNIYDIAITGNQLSNFGEGSHGCITYRGNGKLLIKKNQVCSHRGVSILSDSVEALIVKNDFKCDNYSVQSKTKKSIVLSKNTFEDAIICETPNVKVVKNVYNNLHRPNYFVSCPRILVIRKNRIIRSNKRVKVAFEILGKNNKNWKRTQEMDIRNNIVESSGLILLK